MIDEIMATGIATINENRKTGIKGNRASTDDAAITKEVNKNAKK